MLDYTPTNDAIGALVVLLVNISAVFLIKITAKYFIKNKKPEVSYITIFQSVLYGSTLIPIEFMILGTYGVSDHITVRLIGIGLTFFFICAFCFPFSIRNLYNPIVRKKQALIFIFVILLIDIINYIVIATWPTEWPN